MNCIEKLKTILSLTIKSNNVYIIVLYCCVLVLFSCSKSKNSGNINDGITHELTESDTLSIENGFSHATILTNKEFDSLTQELYQKGDNNAFGILLSYYAYRKDEKSIIKIAKFMSDKYNDAYAQYLVYKSMVLEYGLNQKCNHEPLECMSVKHKRLAIEYLKKSAYNNYGIAIDELAMLKNKGIVK